MAVSFVAVSTANNGQTATTKTIACAIPAGAQAGDTAIFTLTTNSGTATLTAPAGWTQMRTAPDVLNNNLMAQVWAKDLTTADLGTSPVWETTVGGRLVGGMAVLRGTSAAVLDIPAPAQVATAATSHVSPLVTTTVNGTGIYNFWILRVATAAPAPDIDVPAASQTEDNTVKTGFTTSPNYSIQFSHRTTPGTAGSYGGVTSTSSAAATSLVYTIAFAPTNVASGPTASFTAAPQSGYVPLAVTFTNTSTGSPTSYLWDFGDGSTSTSTSPTHTYVSSGTYTVTLTARNATGTSQATLAALVAADPGVTGDTGLIVCVCRSGAWVPVTLALSVTGEVLPPVGVWNRSAPWVRSDPWAGTT